MADTLVTRFGSKAGTLFGGLSSQLKTNERTSLSVFHPCFIRG